VCLSTAADHPEQLIRVDAMLGSEFVDISALGDAECASQLSEQQRGKTGMKVF